MRSADDSKASAMASCLTGIESRCEQSGDLALPERLGFDPTGLEILLDLLN